MQPIDGYWLYELGTQVHPLVELGWQNVPWRKAYFPMLSAQGAISALLHQSIYQVRTCRQDGFELLQLLDSMLKRVPGDLNEEVGAIELWGVVEKARRFETVLRAELGVTPMFYVPPKHNLDVSGLINAGHLSFPPDLSAKVPEALPDAQQAAKCIAFELPTAAGFHLHRANESVLRRYFDHVAGPENRPKGRNMGDYINALSNLEKGDSKVRAALRDLKDLHRNPLMHPEEHIASVEDAVSLMGGVCSVMTFMLKEIPVAAPMTSDLMNAILSQQIQS